MDTKKDEGDNVGKAATVEEMHQTISRGGVPLMRSQEDDLTVWQTVQRYKLVGFIAMSAAFSASLDGYRKLSLPQSTSRTWQVLDRTRAQNFSPLTYSPISS